MSAISGRDAPDMARLPPSSPAASSVGHDKTGHTFRKIAIAAGLVAAVSFFAIAIFATLAIPPIAVVTLPAMTFMAIVGGLAITGTLAASIALVSSVAARVFSHSPKAARAPVAEDIEYVPVPDVDTKYYTKTYSHEEAKESIKDIISKTHADQVDKDAARWNISPLINGVPLFKEEIEARQALSVVANQSIKEIIDLSRAGTITAEEMNFQTTEATRPTNEANRRIVQSYKDTINVFLHGNETAAKNLMGFMTQSAGNVVNQTYQQETGEFTRFPQLPYYPMVTFKNNGEIEVKIISLAEIIPMKNPGEIDDTAPLTPLWLSHTYTFTMDDLVTSNFNKATLTAAAFPASPVNLESDNVVEVYTRDFGAHFRVA